MARKESNQIFENPKLVSAKELATQLGVSKSLVHLLVARDEIPSIKIGRRVVFHVPSVMERLLKKQRGA